jgi:NitT/TauT family transport system substrate-binding protein
LAGEGDPENASVRLLKFPGICIAPQYLAEELLRGEGFTEIRYIDAGPTDELAQQVGRGEADFTLDFAARIIQAIDEGGALTVLGGACWLLRIVRKR